MFGLSLRDPHVYGSIAAAVVCIGALTTWLVLRRRPSAEEIERERRAQLVRTGRIMDGTILDITELETPGEPDHPREIRFILYKYEIGGVENWSGLRTTADSVPARPMPKQRKPQASAPVQ